MTFKGSFFLTNCAISRTTLSLRSSWLRDWTDVYEGGSPEVSTVAGDEYPELAADILFHK